MHAERREGSYEDINTGSQYGYFYALNSDGSLMWQYYCGSPGAQVGTPAISYDGSTVYITADDSGSGSGKVRLLALRRDGTLKWSYLPQRNDLSVNAVTLTQDGLILCPGHVEGGKGPIYAVDTKGMERWRFEGAGNGVTPSAVDNDGNVYFASGTHLYSVGSNGSLRSDANGIDYGSDWEGGATIGRDGTLYVAGASVSAIDYSGRLKWKYDFVVGSPSTGCVPVTDVDGTIYVGRVQDRLQQLQTPSTSSPSTPMVP